MTDAASVLHDLLDWDFGPDGCARLAALLAGGADPNVSAGPRGETALHVAVRRRRVAACTVLLDHGAAIDARTAGAKTAYAHAARRGFDDVVAVLVQRGADITLTAADRLAVAVAAGRLAEARAVVDADPGAVRTGNPEDDRLLADVAGRDPTGAVELLIAAGADLTAPGLDGGTPLHQAAWFGQPHNAALLIAAGAPLEAVDPVHDSTPLGWAAHGSSNAGDAEQRMAAYCDVVNQLLAAGASLNYPGAPDSDAYYRRLRADAIPAVGALLRDARG